MSLDPQGVPQTFINVALAAFTGLFGIIMAMIGFIVNGWRKRFYAIEEAQKRFASVDQVTALDIRVAQTVSRKELAQYIAQVREENQQREIRMREDRFSMHKENSDRMDVLQDDMRETRQDTRAIHQRIDEVLSSK